MPQFSKRNYFGYGVYVYPGWNDKPRKLLHKFHLDRLPYFTGSDIIFSLEIKPTEGAKSCSELRYSWYLIPEQIKDVPPTEDTGINSSPDKLYTTNIVLPHMSFPNNYRLDFEVSINGKSRRQCIADFEITPRSASEFTFIWSVWTLILGLIAFFIGKWVG